MSSSSGRRKRRGGRGSGNNNICFQWRDNGYCRFGNNCKYSHPGGGGGGSSGATNNRNISSSSSQLRVKRSNDETLRFIQHLARLPTNKLGIELVDKASLWRRCWQEHKAFDANTRRMMIEVLAKTPGSSAAEPPPIHLCKEVIDRFFSDNDGAGNDDNALLTTVKTVSDAVTRLLHFEWDSSREDVTDGLSEIIVSADEKLKKKHKDHRDVSARLMEVLEDLEKPWRIKVQNTESEEVTAESTGPDGATDWRSANIKWLCTPTYFSPSCCPKMLSGHSGVYESAEHYMETIYRLWVAMTFADGHSALAPHCRSRGQSNGSCGNALWPVTGDPGHARCRTRGCSHSVEYMCRSRSHDALCGDCATRSVTRHLQGPGQNASTHVYDCKVRHVDPDGILYLSEFKSRNPPPNAIHWRTTRRLSPPSLIGVVKTRSRGATLNSSDAIKWGEVVYHGQTRDEERRRQNGELAINISSIVEIDPDIFEVGAFVAVIDCMSFVPEWIPVLKALESQKNARLPFDNGVPLNLWKNTPAKINTVLNSQVLTSADEIFRSSRFLVIEAMVEQSQLEPIREIRRDPQLKDELVVKLENLVSETTLDKMQLISFIDSLRNAVHLTQGPPGTGKSYLGVVLVRALIIIRDLWIKKSKSVSPPPILVLSYKNMAIDHFLVDLVKAEPTKLSRNQLIRIGGQCKDPRLALYSETNAFQSDAQVKTMRSKVENLKVLRESVQATVDGGIASFLSFEHCMLNENDEQTRRKAANDATTLLMESIIRRHLLASFDMDNTDEDCKADSVLRKLSFLEIDRNKTHQLIKGHIDNPDGKNFILELERGIGHYQQNQRHWGDTLLMWLCGKKPIPKCSFQDELCNPCSNTSLSHEVALCGDHRCSFLFESSSRCTIQCEDSTSRFCREHYCQADRCRRSKLSEHQSFCAAHACKKCIELKLMAKLSTDRPPRNVCVMHPLCTYPSCQNYCTSNGIYCSDHGIVKCKAMTKKGNPCKGQPISMYKPFCRDHQHLAHTLKFETASVGSNSSDSEQDDNVEQQVPFVQKYCAARTKKGRPCKGLPIPNSVYCYDHAPPSTDNDLNDLISKTITFSKHQDSTEVKDTNELANTTLGSKNEEQKDKIDEQSNDDSSSYVNDSNSSVDANEKLDTCGPTDFDELELDEEGENLQHLREVFEVNDNADADAALLADEDYQSINSNEGSTESFYSPKHSDVVSDPNKWTWDMSLEDRWQACQYLMDDLLHLLKQCSTLLKRSLSQARKDFQQCKVRAKARVYENKVVIGGTIVGCISRLESIKATKFFAILIEESSEVLEPLLFSCLSESTLKLEMIGDHRQLQPSIQSRYDFQLCNNVNISMFQRLIEAPQGHNVPATVLSVQRRMRENICNLTREYYADVTDIEDHESCSTKLIGQKSLTGMNGMIGSSSTKGREVPGIGPHIFLWTHNGAQGRSHVGVSRINQEEAERASALAIYLVNCGIPRSSIAILTPYKGQLMLIRKLLLQSRSALVSKDPREHDVVRLSTVDRFQGDEEDIIIASLVVDENSRTPFVKLKNRMIVLLSRARVGMYLLANETFLGNQAIPKHWARTLELLEKPGSDDSSISAIDSHDIFSGIRVGKELTLCCPVHRNRTTKVSNSTQIRTGFCTEQCKTKISCGHECSLQCHWPTTTHNTKCSVKLNSPCQRHAGPIDCQHAFENSFGCPAGIDHRNICSYYRCPAQVDLNLPCGHDVRLPCWEESRITKGEIQPPVCHKESITPFTFLTCGHTRSVTCSEFRKFTANPQSVKCEEVQEYQATCQHKKKMKCWEVEEIVLGTRSFDCKEKVDETLPRCGHKKKLHCSVVQQLASWTGQSCVEVGKIQEGLVYGPQDYPCKTKVKIIRSCNHEVVLPCDEAFSRSNTLHPCREKVDIKHPLCGHQSYTACSDVKKMNNLSIPDPSALYKEGEITPKPQGIYPVPACKVIVPMIRKCQHKINVVCSQVYKPLEGCEEIVEGRSALCGHKVQVACRLRADLEKTIWDPAAFSSLIDTRLLQEDSKYLRNLQSLSKDLKHAFCSCNETTILVMNCGHRKEVKCSNLLHGLTDSSRQFFACNEPAFLRLACNHTLTTTCSEKSNYESSDSTNIKCNESVTQKCWNYSVCSKNVKVNCGFNGVVACYEAIEWFCPEQAHRYNIKLCSQGCPKSCPGCSLDCLNEFAKRPSELPVSQLRACINVLPEKQREEFPNRSSIIGEVNLLQNYRNYIESLPTWDQPVFELQRIPCFRSLQKSNETIDAFDPKRFAQKKSMHGIITKTFTKANLQQLADKTKENKVLTLLVGFAAVARTKVINRLPVKKQLDTLLKNVFEEEYSSMLYQDKGFEHLLVWDPFPLVALFRLRVTSKELRIIAQNNNVLRCLDLQPRYVAYDKPPDGIFVGQSISTETEGNDEDGNSECSSIDDDYNAAFPNVVLGTLLEGFRVDVDWPGNIGSDGSLSTTIESELMEKMQFVNPKAPPFAGYKRLSDLLSKVQDCALLYLLLSAEMLDHDQERAREHLIKYLGFCRLQGSNAKVHPWAVLVVARLNPQLAVPLLSSFLECFPVQKRMLTPSELSLIDGTQASGSSNRLDRNEVIKEEWSQLKSSYPVETKSKAMDDLLSLTGLRKVKEEALRLWSSALQLKRMEPEARKKNLVVANYCFVGNPGCGKTSVARLFAAILRDSGIRKTEEIVETTAQEAKDGGTDKFKQLVLKAMGGVLFIDEAYDLDPVGDLKGKPIVNELLTLCENKREEVSVILAGYEDDFDKKFFSYNVGLKSRFRIVNFDDFDESEMATIWEEMRIDKGWQEDDGVCRVVVNRLKKLAGRKGFGNAREIRKRLEDASQSAMQRLGHDFCSEKMVLQIEDVIGQDPRLSNEKLQRVKSDINQKIGWTRVKKLVNDLIEICGRNYQLELQGKPPLEVFLNRMFLGNPGTGKTTCAKLYGRMLKELGFLSNGDVVSKTASDFVGNFVGESQNKTSTILEGARGKVLIIDEAYVLDDSNYGKQVLDTIVEKVQGSPSDDIAVLLLGYEEQMLTMIRNQNPGLARRFPKEHAFYFDDYTDSELLEIVKLNLKSYEVEATLEFNVKALDVLAKQRCQSNFGNAGAAEMLVKGAMLKAAERFSSSGGTLILDDVDIDDPGLARAEKDDDPLSALDGLYRMDQVKQKLQKMRMTWSVSRQDGDEEPKLGHFVFTGSPGTGKTTVARAIANVLYSLGLLPSDKIKETSAIELTAQYVGQTAPKVKEALKEAKGGVLFIDEAYNLGCGPFGKEACDTLVAAMTDDQFKDVVVIIAGYPHEIDSMLNSNSGLKSRFTHYFEFPDWTPNDCESFFQLLSLKKKFHLEDGILGLVERGCAKMMDLNGWGNGRDVTKLWEECKSNRDARVFESETIERELQCEDVETAINAMLKSRKPKPPSKGREGWQNQGDYPAESAYDNSHDEVDRFNKNENENNKDNENVSDNFDFDKEVKEDTDDESALRDNGVSDEDWNELEDAKKRYRQRIEELKREQEEYEQFLLQKQQEELEAKRQYELELQRIRQQLEKEEQDKAIRLAEEAERRRKEAEEAERRRLEEERLRREKLLKNRQEMMRRLQTIRPCPMGFNWYQVGNGWRCHGGSHFVSDSELKQKFGDAV